MTQKTGLNEISGGEVEVDPPDDSLQRIVEINGVAGLLRRNGYSFADRGTLVVANDPVHAIVGGNLVPCGFTQVVLRTTKAARAFIAERS